MKIVGILLLAAAGLLALLVTACGGLFTVHGLAQVALGQLSVYGAFLDLSVLSLVIGLGVTVLCFRTLRKMNAGVEAPSEKPP